MDLRRILIVAIAVLLATPMYGQDRVFDTEVTADTNLLKFLPGGSQEVFKRKRGPFRVGWNWNGPDAKAIDTVLGIQLIHHYIQGKLSGSATGPDSNMIYPALPEAQFLVVPDGWRLQSKEGYGKATRVDFEIAVDSASGHSAIETDTNTAAVHGFRDRPIGTVSGSVLQLRGSSDSGLKGRGLFRPSRLKPSGITHPGYTPG